MITLTKIDGSDIVVNSDEIEFVDVAHDSRISLKSGRKIIVKDTADVIIGKVIQFRQKCYKDDSRKPVISNQE